MQVKSHREVKEVKVEEDEKKINYDNPLEMLYDENDPYYKYDPKIFMIKLTIIQDKWRQETAKQFVDQDMSKSKTQLSNTGQENVSNDKSAAEMHANI